MNRLTILLFSLIAVCRLPAFGQTVADSLHETVAQIPDTAAYRHGDSGSIPIQSPSPTSVPLATEQNQAETTDSAKGLGFTADTFATSGKQPAAAPVQLPPPSVSKHSPSPELAFIGSDAACEFIIGKNGRLPEDKLFLLGGKELFIASARLSKNIGIGMSGGPASQSSLQIPYGFIYDAQSAAEDRVENDRGISAYSNSFSNSINGRIADDIPFDAQYLLDNDYFWRDSTNTIDFVALELNSLQMYVNAHVPWGMFAVMIKPLAFGKHVVAKNALFRSEFDPALSQMMFAKEGEISTDFAVRNLGINADVAFTRQLNKTLSLYARCPVEYRKITIDATRSISAQFTYYPENYAEYTRYVKLDTLPVAAFRGNSYYFSPRLGLRLDSKADLKWPFVFLPFVARNGTLEGYFLRTHYLQESYYGSFREFGGSYVSFQSIRFGNRFFTGMENISRLNFDCFYNVSYNDYFANMFVDYTPQLIIKEHFFVAGSIRTGHYWPANCHEVTIVPFKHLGFGYGNSIWGLSCQLGFEEAGDKKWYPVKFNAVVWRSWK